MKDALARKIAALAIITALTSIALNLFLLQRVPKDNPLASDAIRTESPRRSNESASSLSDQLIDVAKIATPTVVSVFTETVWKEQVGSPFDFFFNIEPREQEFRRSGLGSGVIVSTDGYILTNNHVVEGASTISVGTNENKVLVAKVIGRDPKTDLAVIKVDGHSFKAIDIGDSADLQVGEIVLAIGSPMSKGLAHTVTQGIVSAVGRSNVGLADYEDFIQTDAAINPGNSGGALVNLRGELVGINTAIVSQSGGSQGIGFAIPSGMANEVMQVLIKNGQIIRGWAGISVQEISDEIAHALNLPESRGALVQGVAETGPAGLAGIRRGDVLLKLGGSEIENPQSFRNRIAKSKPGETLDVTFFRQGKELKAELKLTAPPEKR